MEIGGPAVPRAEVGGVRQPAGLRVGERAQKADLSRARREGGGAASALTRVCGSRYRARLYAYKVLKNATRSLF